MNDAKRIGEALAAKGIEPGSSEWAEQAMQILCGEEESGRLKKLSETELRREIDWAAGLS